MVIIITIKIIMEKLINKPSDLKNYLEYKKKYFSVNNWFYYSIISRRQIKLF